MWIAGGVVAAGLFAWSLEVGGLGARVLAAAAGGVLGVFVVVWSLGGHISAFYWWIGAEGERQTAGQIERLGDEWHCEHDIEHPYGNWDHVLVGPPGVLLLDSKLLHGPAAAGDDTLRSGRLTYRGAASRGGARRLHDAIARQLSSFPFWVQPVVVVWGAFPQVVHEENGVVYVGGEHLQDWLATLPKRMGGPQRAALIAAVREARAALAPSTTPDASATGFAGLPQRI